MNCPKCGAKNPDDENFCQSCGARLSISVAQVVSASRASTQGINKKLLLAIIGAGVIVFFLVLVIWPK